MWAGRQSADGRSRTLRHAGCPRRARIAIVAAANIWIVSHTSPPCCPCDHMGAQRLLPHLASDQASNGPGINDAPGIDLLTLSFVAVVDPISLDDRRVAIRVLASDTRCAVRRPGNGEPLTRLGILD